MNANIKAGADNPKGKALLAAVIKRSIDKGTKDKNGKSIDKCPTVLAKVKAEVRKINPSLKGLTGFIALDDWTFDGKPVVPYPNQDSWDGEANEDGLPKDATMSQKLLEEAKDKCYDAWHKMLDDGAFDAEGATEAKPVEKEAEEIDMAEIARRQKEKEQEKTVDEVVSDKTPSDDKPGPSLMGINSQPVLDQMETLVEYNKVKGTPPIVPMIEAIKQSVGYIEELKAKCTELVDTNRTLLAEASKSSTVGRVSKQHNENRLQNAIEDNVRGVVEPWLSGVDGRIDNIEAKLDQVIDFKRETEGKMTDQLREVVGDIVREKMKGMFS